MCSSMCRLSRVHSAKKKQIASTICFFLYCKLRFFHQLLYSPFLLLLIRWLLSWMYFVALSIFSFGLFLVYLINSSCVRFYEGFGFCFFFLFFFFAKQINQRKSHKKNIITENKILFINCTASWMCSKYIIIFTSRCNTCRYYCVSEISRNII